MSRLLISTVLFLFALLIIVIGRWKEISWLWKSIWGKIVLSVLIVAYVFFNAYDIASKADSSEPSLQSILDTLNIKDKETAKQIELLSKKIDKYNDSLLAHYKQVGYGPRFDSATSDRMTNPLALSTSPQLVYLSEYDVAVVLKLSNLTNRPAFIGNFKSYLVEINNSLIRDDMTPIPRDAVKQTIDKSAIRIGRLKELPSFIDDYQIIIFVHSTTNVQKIKNYNVLYITSLNGKTYCESQSLPLVWSNYGMSEQSMFREPVCTYLDEHFGINK